MVERKRDSLGDAGGGGGRGIARPAAPTEKLCYSVPEAGKMLGFSRNHTYELVRIGEIPAIKLGSRYIIPKKEFHDKFGYPMDH